MMIKKYYVLAFMLMYSILLFGQTPTLVPLNHNPALSDRVSKMLKNSVEADTVSLPFLDDFSYYSRSARPDKTLWMDEYVFINNNYPIQPPSNGVATFDALDENGYVYKNTSVTFPADTLTSCPIDLGVDGLNNVFLSFHYQPGGYGDSPEPGDSLILQFKSPETNLWRTIWKAEGTTVHPFILVLLPVNGEYLYKGFQFRFVNYVSLEQNTSNLGRKGNADHWHIDYVYLNNNRSATDTAIDDVAMIAPMKSLIKGYQSIPWNQLQYAAASKQESMMGLTYRNNHHSGQFVDRFFVITDLYRNIITNSYIFGGDNIEADQIITFSGDIGNNPFESTVVDSALFELKGYLINRTNPDDRKENDTVRFHQFFKDYFARDDGVPENGYGFSGYNAQGCAVACRYETFMPDSVRAIQIYFNPTEDQVTKKYRFKIAVWRDDNGRPGEQLYISSVEYSPETTGRFTQYNLRKPAYVTKYYWIGWVQVTTGYLNVGFDHNYNDKGNLWYNTGKWRQDINDGTLMIRPVMGARKDFSTSTEMPSAALDTYFKVNPNPASQRIRIVLDTSEPVVLSKYDVALYSVTGQLRYRAPFTDDYIDVSSFEPGLYIVNVIHRKSGNMQSQKLMIIR